jgi:hypothetical protein
MIASPACLWYMSTYSKSSLLQLWRDDIIVCRRATKVIFSLRLWCPRRLRERRREPESAERAFFLTAMLRQRCRCLKQRSDTGRHRAVPRVAVRCLNAAVLLKSNPAISTGAFTLRAVPYVTAGPMPLKSS